MTLGELFTRHGSDKESHHGYAATYERLLGPVRATLPAMLEIGIARSASLRAWRDWFTVADIWAIDNAAEILHEPRWHCFRADSRVRAETDAVLGDMKFGFICEDGGHRLDEQQETWENLKERLTPGGVYVVEDIQGDGGLWWFEERDFTVVDLRPLRGHGDDILAVWTRPT